MSTTDQLLSLIEQGASTALLDMDNLLLRQSLDVIGLVGFEQDMGATRSLDSSSQASNCLAVTIPAMEEIERRFREPFRARKFWSKVHARTVPRHTLFARTVPRHTLLTCMRRCASSTPAVMDSVTAGSQVCT